MLDEKEYAMTRSTRNEDERADVKNETTASKLIEETLFKKRLVLITGQINERVARATTERLLALAAQSEDPINVFISSPGGHVESGDMIHDVLKFIKPEVRTIGSGWVASAGALIFVAAERWNRFCLPNTRFLLHQPSGGVEGPAANIEIQTEQLMRMKERFERIFAEATGQSVEQIRKDTRRDFWLDVKQAIAYGLLGSMVESQDEFDRITSRSKSGW
jgi:ATP-dependent Clp protease, protease subunit